MRRVGVILVVVIALLGVWCGPAAAQQYAFSVPKIRCDVYIQADGSLVIDYEFSFTCLPGAHPIDIVDVGMPVKGYEVQSASVDGQPVREWRPSTAIAIGPEVHLDQKTIQPGASGVFRIRASVPRGMIYEDTTDKTYASFQFATTWFDPKFVSGGTQLEMCYIFPAGVDLSTIRAQGTADKWNWQGIRDDAEGRPAIAWVRQVPFTQPHKFSVSFPRTYVASVTSMTFWRLFTMWWMNDRQAQLISGIVFFIALGIFFFLITTGTGWSVFIVILGLGAYLFYVNPMAHLAAWLLIPAVAAIWYYGVHAKKQHYLAASLSVEGGGIKRGLTAVEAAVLLEVPLSRVLSMVIFGMLSRGVVLMTKDDPLTVAMNGTRDGNTLVLADGSRVPLHLYEIGFLEAIGNGTLPLKDLKFQKPIADLVGMVKFGMAGFDVERSRSYYKLIVERAWTTAKQTVDLKQRDEFLDQNNGWLYMDDRFRSRWGEIETGGYYYRPWWFGYGARGSYYGGGTSTAGTGGGAAPNAPSPRVTFGDVTHSFATRAENVSSAMIGSADSFMQSTGAGKGLLNLAGVDHATRDMLAQMAKGSGRGGGFGGCAGCACACACAGGGR